MQEKEKNLIIDHMKEKGYEEELINKYFDKLEKYVMEQAKKLIKGSSGMVEDTTVFNWCEDYFHDEEYLKEPEKAETKEEKNKKTVEHYINNNESAKLVAPNGETTKPKVGKSKEAEGQISLW